MITKKSVTQLSYEITGCAKKVHKTLDQDYLKVFMKNVLNMNWKKTDIRLPN